MISFKGNLVSPTSVIKDYNFIAITANHPTSFVEIDPGDKFDKKALNVVKYIFGSRGQDAALISDIFEYEGQSTNNRNSRYFVLTEQEDDFERIKPSAVLGVTKVTNMDKDNVFVDMIQVNPFYVFNNPYSHLKRCGSSILQSLKDTFSDKTLWLHSPKNLINYFQRKGFEIADLPANKGDALMKFKQKIPSGVIK